MRLMFLSIDNENRIHRLVSEVVKIEYIFLQHAVMELTFVKFFAINPITEKRITMTVIESE